MTLRDREYMKLHEIAVNAGHGLSFGAGMVFAHEMPNLKEIKRTGEQQGFDSEEFYLGYQFEQSRILAVKQVRGEV